MVNLVMILVGVLLSAILLVGNMVVPYPAFVIFTQSKAFILAFVSIVVGIMIGIGIRGIMAEDKEDYEDDF